MEGEDRPGEGHRNPNQRKGNKDAFDDDDDDDGGAVKERGKRRGARRSLAWVLTCLVPASEFVALAQSPPHASMCKTFPSC